MGENKPVLVETITFTVSLNDIFDTSPFCSKEIDEKINNGSFATTIPTRSGELILYPSYETYYYNNDKLCLTRKGNNTKAYLLTFGKHGQEVKKYYINGKRRRHHQYMDYYL